MRIIGGKLKRSKLNFLKNKITRPLRDFVKENLFNILENSSFINIKIKDSIILDLFCGIGSFGIECLSRQAKKVYFVDSNNDAINVLDENLIRLNLKEFSKIIKSEIPDVFSNNQINDKIDLVFLDPPYAEKSIDYILNELKRSSLINKSLPVVIHREVSNGADNFDILNNKLIRDYGRSRIIMGTLSS